MQGKSSVLRASSSAAAATCDVAATCITVAAPAKLSADADLLASMIEFGKLPRAVLDISVAEAYFHCGKALMRSKLWSQDSRVARSAQPSISEVIHEQTGTGTPESQEEVEARYKTQL